MISKNVLYVSIVMEIYLLGIKTQAVLKTVEIVGSSGFTEDVQNI